MYIYIYTHTHIYTHIYTHTHTYIHTYVGEHTILHNTCQLARDNKPVQDHLHARVLVQTMQAPIYPRMGHGNA